MGQTGSGGEKAGVVVIGLREHHTLGQGRGLVGDAGTELRRDHRVAQPVDDGVTGTSLAATCSASKETGHATA